MVNPWGMLVKDVYTAMITTGSGVTTTADDPGAATAANTVRNILLSNSPYGYADFNSSDVRGRLVSYEIRVRYVGTELNRGGEISYLFEPHHDGLQGQSLATMLKYNEAKRFSINSAKGEGWASLLWHPAEDQDTTWFDKIKQANGTSDPSSSGYDAVFFHDNVAYAWAAYPHGAIYINPAVDGSPMEIECWAVVEYAGRNVHGRSVS